MSLVFVNYRVREEPGYATLLHRELEREFGPDTAFLASRSIRAGTDYRREVFERLRACSVFLAVIGPRWGDFHRGAGAFDWVHQEIAEAITSGIRIVPVLVDDAELPPESALPEEIAGLTHSQALRLRHYSFDSDLAALIDELRRVVPPLRHLSAAGRGVAKGLPIRLHPPEPTDTTCRLGIVPGSIHCVRHIDIWVNSENTCMQMARHHESSVSAVIRYWGAVRDQAGRVVEDLVADRLNAVVGGSVVTPAAAIVTPSGSLATTHNVRRIIHVASVHGEPGTGFRQVRDIELCVHNALVAAEQEAALDPAVRTILFPLLGTGAAAGGDVASTAHRMIAAVLAYLRYQPATLLHEISFLAYTVEELAHLRRAMEALIGAGRENSAVST